MKDAGAPDVEAELISVVREWDLAMVANHADAIGRYMADDWIIIGADGSESTWSRDSGRWSGRPASSSGSGESCVLTHLSRLGDPVPP